jgi:hypothetical protein
LALLLCACTNNREDKEDNEEIPTDYREVRFAEITGGWVAETLYCQSSYFEFNNDGTFTVYDNYEVDFDGTFELAEGELILRITDEAPIAYPYALENGKMHLTFGYDTVTFEKMIPPPPIEEFILGEWKTLAAGGWFTDEFTEDGTVITKSGQYGEQTALYRFEDGALHIGESRFDYQIRGRYLYLKESEWQNEYLYWRVEHEPPMLDGFELDYFIGTWADDSQNLQIVLREDMRFSITGLDELSEGEFIIANDKIMLGSHLAWFETVGDTLALTILSEDYELLEFALEKLIKLN